MLSVSVDRLVTALQWRGVTLSWEIQQSLETWDAPDPYNRERTMEEARLLVDDSNGHDGDIACELWALIASREKADCERRVNSRYQWLSGPDNQHNFLIGLLDQKVNDYNAGGVDRFQSDGISNRRIDW